MAKEKLSSRQEQERPSPEAIKDSLEQQERLAEQHERSVENAPERNREREQSVAEEEAKEQAQSKEIDPRVAEKKTAPERRGAPNKEERAEAFDKTMTEIRKDMSAPARSFSKLIHAKPVEKASEAIGATVARPNAIAMAGASALLFTAVIYIISRYYGYQLSGFESIGTFILGWFVGLLVDYVRVGIMNRSN